MEPGALMGHHTPLSRFPAYLKQFPLILINKNANEVACSFNWITQYSTVESVRIHSYQIQSIFMLTDN